MGVCRARSPRSPSFYNCVCPLLANGVCACGRRGSDRSALLRARGMSGSACRGHRRGRCGSRAVAVLSEGTLARDVIKEYSRGTPPMGTVRGSCRGTWLLLVRRSTGERPSPLRFCSDLSSNALTGSVPSWLSALTNLAYLCVPPSCQRRLYVRLTWVGSVGSAPSVRHVGGCMSGTSSRAVRQQGCCGILKRGSRARAVSKEYSRGTPSYGLRCAGTVGAHRCRGCGVAPPSRAAESASGVQLPQPERADGECAVLALRAHQA
jgi:hypothetical protein